MPIWDCAILLRPAGIRLRSENFVRPVPERRKEACGEIQPFGKVLILGAIERRLKRFEALLERNVIRWFKRLLSYPYCTYRLAGRMMRKQRNIRVRSTSQRLFIWWQYTGGSSLVSIKVQERWPRLLKPSSLQTEDGCESHAARWESLLPAVVRWGFEQKIIQEEETQVTEIGKGVDSFEI